MVVQNLKKAIELMRKDLVENRDLNYEEGSIGITSLIYCPLKVELRKQYPEMKVESNAIDDGYIFENTLEPYIEKVFNGEVIKDADIPYELDGFKITGHPDFVINQKEKVIILEFKAPIAFFTEEDLSVPEDGFIVDTEGKVKISETYILQTKIQKFITEKYFNKPVEGYLFLKTMIRDRTKRMQKVYVLRPVEETITEEQLRELINDFRTKKYPRYKWECNYCIFLKNQVCQKGMLLQKMNEI